MSTLAGIVVLMRHGDRLGFYQSPTTYAASQTNLTVLGQQQTLTNGRDLRSTYIADGAPKQIEGISPTLAQDAQLSVIADGAGEGEVIIDSAYAMLQGLYPAAPDTIALADGTSVTWNGTQAIRVNTLSGPDAYTVEGFTSCDTFQTRLSDWYASDEFKQQAAVANPFFKSLQPVLGSRPLKLENAWNLYDFLNVETIHNQSVASQVSTEQLENARYWANYHEAGSFTDPDPANIGNVAGQSILPTLTSSLKDVANATNPLKVSFIAISYKPFLSLFSMWDVPEPTVSSIVDYASTIVLEVHTDNTFNVMFRNGTQGDWAALPIMSQTGNVAIDSFETQMQPYGLDTLADWCNACQTDDANNCNLLSQYNGTGGAGYASITSTNGHHRVSPVVAGVIGAMVTLAFVAILMGLGLVAKRVFGGGSSSVRRRRHRSVASAADLPVSSDRASSNGTRAGSLLGSEKGVEVMQA